MKLNEHFVQVAQSPSGRCVSCF